MSRLEKIAACIEQANDRKLLRLLNRAWWREWFRIRSAAPQMLNALSAIAHVTNEISDGRGENNLGVIRAIRAVSEGALRKAGGA